MKDAQPLVTVIVVTLNNLNLLRNCLRSLYTQDYAAMEIIVVDNGSDDGGGAGDSGLVGYVFFFATK